MGEDTVSIREVQGMFDDFKAWMETKLDGVRSVATCDERHRSIDTELAFYRKLLYWALTFAGGSLFSLILVLVKVKGN